jgi:hypothetical protein
MIIKRLGYSIAIAAFFLLAAWGLRYAANSGMIGADDAKRAIQVLIGLGLAAYANIMPKQLGPGRSSPQAEARAQAVLRFGGWSLTLAGLAYALLWAFAPLPVADIVATATVASALVATIAYALWSFTSCRSDGDPSASH